MPPLALTCERGASEVETIDRNGISTSSETPRSAMPFMMRIGIDGAGWPLSRTGRRRCWFTGRVGRAASV
jgi:hypothetical protein